MTLITETFSLPAHWASYLINGDATSFSLNDGGGDAELKMIDDWLEANTTGGCLDCSEQPEFSWHNDGPEPSLGCDVLDYTFAVQP